MKRAYVALAYLLIALGVVHMAATFRFFDGASQAALWFLGGGLLIVLTGALNLLNREYGGVAPGLQRVCIATNVVMTVFALAAGLVGRASVTELCVIVGLFVGATVLSASPRALLAYPPTNPVRDGAWHRIRVAVSRIGSKVRARRGYRGSQH